MAVEVAAALTRAELQEELQLFSQQLLEDTLERFAERTAKEACLQLEELLTSLTQLKTSHQGGRPERKSLVAGDLDWGQRPFRSAKVEEPKGNSATLADIWHAVRERKPKLKSTPEKDEKALNSGDDEKVGSKDEKVGSKDEKLGSKESPAEPVSPKTRSLRRPLPGLLADLEGPPTAPSVEHPMTPATSPECLEAKPLASSLQKGPRHRKMLPGLEQSERTEVQFEVAQLSARSNKSENKDEDEVPDMPAVKASSSRGSKGKSVRKRQTRTSGKMLAAWDPLVQRVNQPSMQGLDSSEYEEDTVESNGKPCRQIYEMIVYAWPLEYLSLFAILLNAVVIGIETDTMSRHLLADPPRQFIAFGWAFCAFFTLEMVLKISANPSRFFKGIGWQMNIFDLSLVALQWLDVLVTASATDDSSSTNFNVMRIIRMVRLVRIVRSYRVLRMLGEVRAIVWSVGTSFKPLLGAMLVLIGVIYLMAVYLVDTCNAYRVAMEATDPGFQPLGSHFGSVGGGMLTLWQAMTGGVDWAEVMDPLLDHTSPIAVAIFLFYIAFSLLALLNLITGVFVESAVKRGKEDKDNYLVQYVRGVFKKMEQTNARVITWEDFQASLDSTEMKELFKAIDLDISEAHCVFKILDLDDHGALDADDLLSGCLRLRSPAKTLDVLVLMREIRSMQMQIMEQMGGEAPEE